MKFQGLSAGVILTEYDDEYSGYYFGGYQRKLS